MTDINQSPESLIEQMDREQPELMIFARQEGEILRYKGALQAIVELDVSHRLVNAQRIARQALDHKPRIRLDNSLTSPADGTV